MCWENWMWRKHMIVLIGIFLFICLWYVDYRKNEGGGSCIVFPQLVSLFWLIIAHVVSLRAQGDPLSSMLFVIVMKALSIMIDKAVCGGFISGFTVGTPANNMLMVSHLFYWFADFLWSQPWSDYTRYPMFMCFKAVFG